MVCAFALCAGCAKATNPQPPSTPTPTPTPAVENPLNGAMVPPDAPKHRVAAVMIDNYPDARPQSGLYDADVVYEVEAEGGITRYLALFLGAAPTAVGPVRSARTYFVDLARPYDPFFAHAGQNDDVIDVLRDLRNAGFADMDEIQHTPEAFWRDNSRDMPHNLYTGVSRMRKVGPTYGYADKAFSRDRLTFGSPPPTPDADGAQPNTSAQPSASQPPKPGPSATPAMPPVPNVVASFWLEYDVDFVWDGAAYQRFIDGQPQHDRDDDRPYEVDDIVAVWIPAKVLDTIGDLSMNVYGSYPAVLIRDGLATEGTWNAAGPDAPPRLVDDSGEPLVLKPGHIYIEIMPQGSSLTLGKKSWSH
ncbi:MAG: DUF3048 domain-containing protein [Candidatus Eremiobacteraeota bacterium]|nr:DUF3048 domain-containing protein [Candidatus Eremiobacteraeota bacterium]